MKEKKRTISPGMNVGSSSILVTFVLLCLVTFAALSFVSARADYNLAVQTSERIIKYYANNSTAEIYLANIDSQLLKLAETADKTAYFDKIEAVFSDNDIYTITKTDDDVFIHYDIEISDTQTLNVTVKALYPTENDGSAIKITQWENVTVFVPEQESLQEEKGGFLF